MKKILLQLRKYIIKMRSLLQEIGRFSWKFVFYEKPCFLFPVRFLILIISTFICRGKCPDFGDLHKEIKILADKLKKNNQVQWAVRIEDALYAGQSSWEILGELNVVLQELKKQKFIQELKLKKDVKKAISLVKRI